MELVGPFASYGQFWRAHGIEHLGLLVPPEITFAAGATFIFRLFCGTAQRIPLTWIFL